MSGMGVELGAHTARSRALAVLRIRSRALALALLPAAVAVVLLVGGSTGHIDGPGWGVVRAVVTGFAVLVLLCAVGVALLVARSRPAMSPTVPVAEESAPDLYRMVRDLADRLEVPAPSAIALTPDCDSWLEDRTHPAHTAPRHESADEEEEKDEDRGKDKDKMEGGRGLGGPAHRRTPAAPVLVIGSPFLWWMRVGELRAVLAPVVAGTGPSAHPDIAAARRFVRGLDAAVAVASASTRGPLTRPVLGVAGWVARIMLRGCRVHAAEMERGVATAAAERAQTVDYGLRIVAQEQVGLAYAGWDRLLTRVALPAWRMGRWPSRLDAGVVAALTELSRRDRLAEGFTSRLGERPACDLLEEPGAIDEATSLLAARLFHGGPAETGPDWAPVDWAEYPDEVVDRKWRTDAARLHRVLDGLGVSRTAGAGASEPEGPTLDRVMAHLTSFTSQSSSPSSSPSPSPHAPPPPEDEQRATEAAASATDSGATAYEADAGPESDEDGGPATERSAELAAVLSAELAREEAATSAGPTASPGSSAASAGQGGPDLALWDDGTLPLFPLQPPRTGRELLSDHVTAMVCCAAMDTAGAMPGLDWLDGPSLLVNGERSADLGPRVLSLIEEGDPAPLRAWLLNLGVRPEKPVRLV
ncbi:hypothetical protein K3769_21600 [Streptomyces sp. A15ISP2-DRY2]|uniref:Integral membrane protein n=2 Tax=Streptomyces ortus TaxID=2867268 RepID=A0ABT3V6Z9_9ACTN|nr:hypothetical protein [Streptomyces ortus]MCX4235326.1 hypothetical protein [Streptomyces ortus]